jgi:hypothetical protein
MDETSASLINHSASLLQNLPVMKTSLLSFVAALGLFASTASYAAAPASNPFKDRKEMARIERERAAERARRESIEREQKRRLADERARIEAQRRAEQQRAAERARWEAQHRHDDRRDDRGRR